MKKKLAIVLFLMFTILSSVACSGSGEEPDGDVDSDGDSDLNGSADGDDDNIDQDDCPYDYGCEEFEDVEIFCGYFDDDCPRDMYCSSEVCHDCYCEYDSECRFDFLCNGCNCVECIITDDCPRGQYCIDEECMDEECYNDWDCPTDYYCSDYKCKKLFCDDDSDCEDGKYCLDGICTYGEPSCETDSDCTEITEECDGWSCVPIECIDNSHCPPHTVCGPGICVIPHNPCPPTDGFTIDISGGTNFLSEDEEIVLTANLYDADGSRVFLGWGMNHFSWSISDSAIATLVTATDTDQATLKGGAIAGEVTLSVSICDGETKVENTITFTNFAKPLTTDSRVLVFDSSSGEPLAGVKVLLNSSSSTLQTHKLTDAHGVALFKGLDCINTACDLHVLPENHTYVSAFGLLTNDILIPVAPNIDTTVAGGVKGKQNHSEIPADLRGDVFLAFSSFALAGNLSELNFENILGEMINTRIKVGGTIDEMVPLPGGLEGYLNPDTAVSPLKDGFQATGKAGNHTLWGLGGFTNLTDILTILGPAIGGGEIEMGPIVASIIPIFANFHHGIMHNIAVEQHPKIIDSNDINGNGNIDELVPDFDKFTELEDSFVLSQAQTQSAIVKHPELPQTGEQCIFDSAVTIIGVMQEGEGFVPLGLSAALDEDENANSDCILEDRYIAFAPQHSGLSGYTYYTVSLALNMEKLTAGFGKDDTEMELSVAIARSESIPTEPTLPSYLTPMTNSTYDLTTHTLTTTDISGADLHRAIFSLTDENSQNEWQIYWKDGNGFTFDFASLGITEDRTANFKDKAKVQAISLIGTDYDQLFSFNASNLNDMNGFTESFSVAKIKNVTAEGVKTIIDTVQTKQ